MTFTHILRIVLLLVFLAVASTGLIFQNQRTQNANNLELDAATHAVHQAMDRIILNMLDAQRLQRGYTLTEQPALLARHLEQVDHLQAEMQTLHQAIRSPLLDSALRTQLNALVADMELSWDLLAQRMLMIVRLTESGQSALAHKVVATGIGELWIREAQQSGLQAESLLEQAGVESNQALAFSDQSLAIAFWLLAASVIALFLALVHQHIRRIDRPLKDIEQWLRKYKAGKPISGFARVKDPQIDSLSQGLQGFALALNQANRDKVHILEEQLEAQEEFSAVLAHEIRTPMNSVIGMIGVAESEGIFQNHSDTLQKLKGSAENLLTLINSSLDYRRLKEGKYRADEKPVKPQPFLKFAVDQAKLVSGKDCLNITLDNQISETTVVFCDAGKVQQILTNLLSNAVKFTGCGTIWLSSSLSTEGTQTRWNLTVKDSGIGMSEKTLSRLFTPFFQADKGAQRKYGGTGLGLALSREIARALGGTITVESELGKGSEFTLSIPVRTGTKTLRTEALAETDNPSDHMMINLQGRKGLMVEDHTLNAKINTKLFKGWTNCDMETVATGEEAVQRMEQTVGEGDRIDFILMDINLGDGITGIEATRQIKAHMQAACPPIFALTAGVLDSDKQKVIKAGMSGFISKPFTENDVLNVMGPYFPLVHKPKKPASTTVK